MGCSVSMCFSSSQVANVGSPAVCEENCLKTPGCVLAAYTFKDTNIDDSKYTCKWFTAEEISRLNFEFPGNSYSRVRVQQYYLTFIRTCQMGGSGYQ